MIGLERNTVKVVDYDPDWARLGAEVCQTIRSTCGELLVDVQHVGSTAVPGSPAKPVLDIAAATETFDSLPEIVRRLTGIGYRYRRDQRDAGGHLFVADTAPDIRTIHVHLVEHAGCKWREFLRFRDLLCGSPELREAYAKWKRQLASLYPDDRESYTISKAGFIRAVLDGDAPAA